MTCERVRAAPFAIALRASDVSRSDLRAFVATQFFTCLTTVRSFVRPCRSPSPSTMSFSWIIRSGSRDRLRHTNAGCSKLRYGSGLAESSAFRSTHVSDSLLISLATVIHSGVEPVAQPCAARDGGYFLTVSTIEPRKNHLTLLRAFANARRAGLDLRWIVVGQPGYGSRNIVERLRRAPSVEFVSSVGEARLEELMAGASFVAVPSFGEGFGFPPLEAMARAVPVCCSTGSALDETVGDAAVRVDASDTRGWEAALLSLAGDNGCRQALVERGRAQVKRFDWKTAARRYAEVLSDAS